jgi:hypothetical protein
MARHGRAGVAAALGGAAFLVAGLYPVTAQHLSHRALGVSVAPKVVSSTGTVLLRGTMTSTATLILTGAFSVGPATTNLDWDLPLNTGDQANGYRETVTGSSFVFSTPPDSQADLTVGSNAVRRFHWDVPPPNRPLTVTETLHVAVAVSLAPFQSTAPYPLGNLPATARFYLTKTALTTLPGSAMAAARRLARDAHTEQVVVTRVADWIADSLRTGNIGALDARTVLRTNRAGSAGYNDAMAAMLRELHIPARVVYGWLSAVPLRLPVPPGVGSIPVWSLPGNRSQAHSWLEVYFPGAGWVPFDPQAEKFFVDSRHFALLHNVDAGTPVDAHGAPWFGSWTAQHPSGQSATGSALGGGESEITPGDGIASQVTIRSRDRFAVQFFAFRRDLRRAQLFAR